MKCIVCESQLKEPVFSLNNSITSLGSTYNHQKTEVWRCEFCTHLQNTPISDLSLFYDKNYNILINSTDEDQLYFDLNGNKKFRIDHQVDCLMKKLDIPYDAEVLDYGSGKGLSIKKLCERRKDITPHLFDVSSVYKKYWDEFCKHDNYSTYEIKKEWRNKFDLVLSFFALEHVENTKEFFANIHHILKDKGLLYGTVPYVYDNPGDFCVLDHINHFSKLSLHIILQKAGFIEIEIDVNSHFGSAIFTARKCSEVSGIGKIQAHPYSKENILLESDALIKFWNKSLENISAFGVEGSKKLAIYGSGFYGSFIANSINMENVLCFIDQNPYRQGLNFYNKPIVSSKNLPKDITDILVGLNPNSAKKAISAVINHWPKNIKIHYPFPVI
ncbi:MAG: hypothetical protein CMM87_03135 [Rickettsiales bacterium]|nr:hypothetical protein [Rickettsiales bacterium]|tara:strand:+ start:20088 stop:21248 length:1161 start_codon:yes stop_codon:yes gene_type:complete